MPIVETRYGKVEGQSLDGIYTFKGIPYAEAPTGARRWSRPATPTPWTSVRSATNFGPISWQLIAPPGGPLSFSEQTEPPQRAEDCLTLNIWSPALDDQRRPVMVWIHGGGFSSGTGASPIYDGQHLVNRGNVVLVTINYRLGALGFLNLNEVTGGRIPSTGNEGMFDQIASLQWVQDNISAFGGDPNNVTIFGESAGGMSVGALLGMHEAQGLFHKAIPQSGASSTANPIPRSAEIAEKLIHRLGLTANSDLERLLLALDPETLTNEASALGGEMGSMIFQPCIDGNELPDVPLNAVKAGSADEVSVLVGATRDESRLFVAMDPRSRSMTEADLTKRFSERRDGVDLSGLAANYKSFLQDSGRNAEPVDVYSAVESDRSFRMPGIRLAEVLASRGKAAYQYLFTVESPASDGFLGACHAIDIGYVFGTHSVNDGTKGFFGSGEDVEQLSNATQDAWIRFAHTGNPRTEALADWAAYTKQDRSTAIFGIPANTESAPFDEMRELWNDEAANSTLGVF